jgi:hypothetical protein
VLHAAAPAVGRGIVAERGALPRDPRLERAPDGPVQAARLVGVELARRAEGMDPRPPERLVRVDVSHPGQRPLIEDRGLDGSFSACKPLAKGACRERG